MHHISRALTVISLALAAWCVFALVGKSSANTAMIATVAEIREQNAAIVEAAYREKRADSLKYARELAQVRAAERKLAARLDGTLTSAGMAVDSARAVLADSLASSATLRYSLTFTVAKLDTLTAQSQAYRAVAEGRFAADSAERVFLLGVLSQADTVIAAKNLAIAGWRKAADCRIILGIKCPTRTMAFVGGMLVTGAAIIALR